jgi:alkyldihydroxyacetonephosphate synthase
VRREQVFWGWGEPGAGPSLPEHATGFLREMLGVSGEVVAPPPSAPPTLPASRLPASLRGLPGLRDDDEIRLLRAAGKSYLDLLAMRSGSVDAPDAVVAPASHDEVVAVLRACTEEGVAVVPFGGGTSVVGGLAPLRDGHRAVISLDLGAMEALSVDERSLVARIGPGLRLPECERALGARGLTLGHFPQSFEYASLGGFAATRSSGQASAGYGRFDRMVVGLRAATPIGTLDVGRAPESAAGPDLRQLLLGSEGIFGVITELTLRVRPAPAAHRYTGWAFPSFAAGARALRALAQDGPLPTVLRLSDEAETAINAATGGGADADGGCLAVVGCEGTQDDVAARYDATARRLTRLGGTSLGEAPGEQWRAGRFRAPYLRDALLDAGALAETLETAAFWDRLPETYAAVRDALVETMSAAGTPPLVLCHISHVYETGASLYFTVVAAQADDPVAQWRAGKAAAGDAIAATGATITHHHGVGRDHKPWYAREIGPVGIAALRGVKESLDPYGILNPQILLP